MDGGKGFIQNIEKKDPACKYISFNSGDKTLYKVTMYKDLEEFLYDNVYSNNNNLIINSALINRIKTVNDNIVVQAVKLNSNKCTKRLRGTNIVQCSILKIPGTSLAIKFDYSDNNTVITTSNLPSTTIDSIEVVVNDNLTLIDTPGLLDNNDVIEYIDFDMLKKIIPNKELKPITYQIKGKQSIFIENLVRVDIEDKNSLTIYMSNNLEINRLYKDTDKLKELKKHELLVEEDNDIVIQGLGFIKFTKPINITIYTPKRIKPYTRNNLI
jgi:hypothetical protein